MKRRRWSEGDLVAVREAVAAGDAAAAIAGRFGVSAKAVGVLLCRLGLTRRHARSPFLWSAHLDELRALVKAGRRYADIAAHFGVGYSSVAMACHRAGIRPPARVISRRNRKASRKALANVAGRARALAAAQAALPRGRGVKVRRWCPEPYVDDYFKLVRRGFPAAEARSIILQQVNADVIAARRAAVAAVVRPSFDDVLARVARGDMTICDRGAVMMMGAQ